MASKIEWTNETWNPVTGCNKVSPGCKNCYAERMAHRLKAMGLERYSQGFKLRVHPESLSIPFGWKTSRLVFVNSMSDLFHKDVPFEFIQEVFLVMNSLPQHTFQVLTKRSDRLLELSTKLNWTSNIWMGVSVESQDYVYRIKDLSKTHAKTKFLSIEPLIGEIKKMPLKNINWIIVGGESGPGSRPMNEEWVLKIRDMSIAASIPFFFKQWGGVNKKKTGRILEKREWNEMPTIH